MKFPTITLEVCAVEMERDTHDVSTEDGHRGRVAGEARYEARFTSGGYAEITKDDFIRLSAAMNGAGDE